MKELRTSDLTEPRVTIGMPVFQNAATLERAIASVRIQSFSDWRLIVSDDCSGDATFEIARKAAREDARIEVRRNPNRLGYANFAQALKEARTQYFVWLAGDDYWAPDFLERTVAALDAAPAAVSALPEAMFVGAEERPVPNLGFLKGQGSERVRRYLAYPGGTRMYGLMRTAAAQASFPKKPGHAYDWYLMVALLARGPQVPVPGRLLFREETGWIEYARSAERAFPILETSLALVQNRKIPLGALPALIGLNLRKHEEFLAVNRPETFQRRRGVFRRLGLPLSKRPDRLAELAAWHRKQGSPATAAFDALAGQGQAEEAQSAANGVTAILACRNAESTIGAWLDHMATLGGNVVVIDHGSTDLTRKIAASRSEVVEQIVDMPYEGGFDLTEQLALKEDIIAGLEGGWVIHADADEFITLPDGMTLAELVCEAEDCGAIAVACDEYLHLPRFEDEVHASKSFRQTMTASVIMREHDEKQRLFRADADLGLWKATGGHTVTRDPGALADRRLRLDHYIGLSLDDIRGQYLGRVFARCDRMKLWHGNRAAAQSFEIVPPDPALFADAPTPVRSLPIFRPLASTAALRHGAIDLVVFAGNEAQAREALARVLPGLRLFVSDSGECLEGVPVFNLLTHPAQIHRLDLTRSAERARAVGWTRRVAAGRQRALDRDVPYAELRLEDVTEAALMERVRGLMLGPILSGTSGFVDPEGAKLELRPYETPVRDITQALAADLGYV